MKSPLHQIAIVGFALLESAAFAIAQNRVINSVPYTISSPGYYSLERDLITKANAEIQPGPMPTGCRESQV
jgi:hypothetical protein